MHKTKYREYEQYGSRDDDDDDDGIRDDADDCVVARQQTKTTMKAVVPLPVADRDKWWSGLSWKP
jgi:hypothetical protein